MKYLLLLVVLTSTVHAAEYEIGGGVSQMNINWIADSEFSPQLYTIEGTAWLNNYVGTRIQYGMSDWVSNDSTASVYASSKAKIKSYYSILLVGKYPIYDNINIEFMLGSGAYDQAVTNFWEDGYSNSDSGYHWGIGISRTFNDNWSLRISYMQYHDKTKTQEETLHFLDGDGHETTSSVGLTLNYRM